ncbi:uncharacterized protein LOC143536558 [Bidens hawaiensis]|uniref:uncharacterized protein LOC143536558 n=1 Tax=Bidens hawaiensis TaxID=980011 RepID=UPI00404A7814
MDHDWMYKASYTSEIYAAGVQSFLSAAEANRVKKRSRSICCPCSVCQTFQYFEDITEIEAHLFENGFMPRYDCWSRHGESLAAFSTSSTANDTTYNDDASSLNSTYNNDSSNLDENDNHLNGPDDNLNEMLHDMETNMGDAEIENLQHLFEDAEKPLYTGSRLNKLDAVLNLSNLKSKNKWSDKSFTKLLVFLHDRMLLEDNELPISTYRAKKLMCPMGLEVERIHACPNNCILYRKRYENEHKCVVCGASRYKQKKDSDEVDDDEGPKQPGNNIDVYLSPLIDDLKTLWDLGVNLYDAYGKEHFQLHATIFCTINDFPAYDNLSGYTTKGKKACPVCENETSATRDVFSTIIFDIMVHLISHIVQEIKACGPVFLRYMYPFERYMSVLEGYVRNRHRPEGGIIEGYTSEEVIEFWQGYVKGLDSVGIPKTRHSGRLDGHARVGFKTFSPSHEDLHDAHFVVLKHMTCLAPYANEHMQMLRLTHPGKDDM